MTQAGSKTDSPPRIAILLATHNGARFLGEQLDSVLNQSCRHNFFVLARDDASTDTTGDILHSYASCDPRLQVIPGEGPALGPAGNFDLLMGQALQRGATHALFCDQDDVWLPGRLETFTQAMLNLEQSAGGPLPALVCSDLTVVDDGLRQIAPSYLRYRGLRHDMDKPLRNLLMQNLVPGCASMVNRRLLEIAHPLPPGPLMHDWWCALLAASAGRIEYIDAATVLYRQHRDNALGARYVWSQFKLQLRRRRTRKKRETRHLIATVRQARAALQRLQMKAIAIPPQAEAMLYDYGDLLRRHPLHRLTTLLRYGIRRHGLTRPVRFYLLAASYQRHLPKAPKPRRSP